MRKQIRISLIKRQHSLKEHEHINLCAYIWCVDTYVYAYVYATRKRDVQTDMLEVIIQVCTKLPVVPSSISTSARWQGYRRAYIKKGDMDSAPRRDTIDSLLQDMRK